MAYIKDSAIACLKKMFCELIANSDKISKIKAVFLKNYVIPTLEASKTDDVVEVEQIEIIRADLKWWLETNTEKGVVFIPEFFVENMIAKMDGQLRIVKPSDTLRICRDKNPKNKIEDKTVFRLAMLLYKFTDILATALTNHNEEKISFVLGEFERADENNCPIMVHKEKGRALYALRHAQYIKRKREGLKTTKYEDVLKQYPELVNAIEQTLNRPAWNER